MARFNRRAILLLACLSIMLAVIDAGVAMAHHREGHSKGGGDGGDGGGGNDGRESFNAGVLRSVVLCPTPITSGMFCRLWREMGFILLPLLVITAPRHSSLGKHR